MENKLTYTKVGDYYIPNLTIKPSPPIGKYGRMRRDYLRDHRPALYNRLILRGKLGEHCADINEAIQNRLDVLIPQLAKSAGVTEKLKESDQMKWVGLMNTCKAETKVYRSIKKREQTIKIRFVPLVYLIQQLEFVPIIRCFCLFRSFFRYFS